MSELSEQEKQLFSGILGEPDVQEYNFVGKVERGASLFHLWVALNRRYGSVLIAQGAWYVSAQKMDNFDFVWSVNVRKDKVDELIELLRKAKEMLSE